LADFSRRDFPLHESEPTGRSGTPALVVFYAGAPDTTPELAADDSGQGRASDGRSALRGRVHRYGSALLHSEIRPAVTPGERKQVVVARTERVCAEMLSAPAMNDANIRTSRV
jgi:hypothetical protein